MGILIVGIWIQQCRLFVSHTHLLYPLTLLIVPLLPQPSVPVSGMCINCGNEGHPEELLESSSIYNRPGWEVAACWEPHEAPEKHHMFLTHQFTSQGATGSTSMER